jgi:hypothetical protein
MPTTRPLRTAWKSLWIKSRSGRAQSHRAMTPETLETRILPAATSIVATADGYARDANRDGTFTVLDSTGGNLLVRNTTGTNVGYERSMIEFDLTNISTALTVDSATLVLNVSQFTKDGIQFPTVNVIGYTGNGSIELTDASVAGTIVGTASVTARGELRINLDTNFIHSQGGNFLGLRLENPIVNGPFGIYSTLESGFPDPTLELNLSLNIADKVFNVNEQRPNGTIVGDAGIGNNATYAVLSGDPTNIFDLDPNTGIIRVADSSQLTFTGVPHVLNVQATLPDGTVGTYKVTINVKNVFGPNNPPTIQPANFTIEEFSPVGTAVGQVIAVDPDAADPLSYAIVGGNTNNAFAINSATGAITVQNQTALSFRDQAYFTLTVRVQDTRLPRSEVFQTIQVYLTPRLSAVPSGNGVQLNPGVDGEFRDGVVGPLDGVFESLNQTAPLMRVDPGPINRRAVMEFDLSGISRGRILRSAYLSIDVSGQVGSPVPINIYGYVGNGVLTQPDAVAGSVLLGQTAINTNASINQKIFVGLNPTLIQQLLGTSYDLGMVFRNDVNGNGIDISTMDGPVDRRPTLHLVFDDTADDVVFNDPTTQAITVARSTGSAFTSFAASALRQGVTFAELVTGDFNGDGRLDIAGRNAANGQILVALAAANQFVTGAAWTTFSTVTTFKDIVVGDFNGDGRDDIAGRSAQGQLLVAISTGTKFNNIVFDTLPTTQRALSNVKVGDFNGDGRDDLMGVVTATGQVVVSISTGSSFTSSVWGTVPVGSTNDVAVGDFNGDGRDDIFTRQGVSSLVVLRSTGNSFVSTPFGSSLSGVLYAGFRVGDFNGDGLADVVGFTSDGVVTVYRSTGGAFVPITAGTLSVPAAGIPASDIVIGDFNRDGKSDILVKQSVSTTVNGVTTTTQRLFVSLGTAAGPFSSSLWGTLNAKNTLTLLGVGNY